VPIWAAVAIAAAAYTARSAMRGWDFRPDLYGDVIAYGLLVFVLTAVGVARSRTANASDDHLPDEVDREHHRADSERQDDDIPDDIE
jgi:hypothetical protein